ncbi:hypothetical protein EJ05DRAFT_519051 [Pseudovirgaria hyperparasitica]|uniref:Uncharacterized protein n=1 Tax=Pseudovirgaria hyperparasitica TaxID=470096 RepID=A0A6A6VZJ1_9PEZI|nr:uncharacterized protein EJ05DRAFT_519051 [Pseudovirgaria hyperparasitica]KAF2755299.1 hypothetical protein EJ05DRAFT_519051 [Pseudovirgaria hyperparasitica]
MRRSLSIRSSAFARAASTPRPSTPPPLPDRIQPTRKSCLNSALRNLTISPPKNAENKPPNTTANPNASTLDSPRQAPAISFSDSGKARARHTKTTLKQPTTALPVPRPRFPLSPTPSLHEDLQDVRPMSPAPPPYASILPRQSTSRAAYTPDQDSDEDTDERILQWRGGLLRRARASSSSSSSPKIQAPWRRQGPLRVVNADPGSSESGD